ncbi:hypothetical protein [Nocardia brasiliensis]|uniref:hypothetical protein n=1 Tax=Nocardia brasiliensis TaxID=37326 RepID=UPI0024566BE6|nr:hypothetical protein [Nocardia brasiliensis]
MAVEMWSGPLRGPKVAHKNVTVNEVSFSGRIILSNGSWFLDRDVKTDRETGEEYYEHRFSGFGDWFVRTLRKAA